MYFKTQQEWEKAAKDFSDRMIRTTDEIEPAQPEPEGQATLKGVVVSGDSRKKTITVQIDGNVTGVMIGAKVSVILP
jgi:hypothetical protein